jgi:hypothetical protein
MPELSASVELLVVGACGQIVAPDTQDVHGT